jgi:hypothetical protein
VYGVSVFHIVNSRVRSLMQTCLEQSGWDQLSCLSTNNIADLERRSWRWPLAAHNSLRRAAQPYIARWRGRAFSHNIGKLRY